MRWHRRAALAVAAASVLIGVGGVALAASTHTLPLTAGRDEAPNPTSASHVPRIPRGAGTGEPAAPTASASSAPDPANTQGPDATGPAKSGLCTAYASGQGGTNGNKFDSTAFQALATAAGGTANIGAFCADVSPGGNDRHTGATPPVSKPVGGPANADAAKHPNSASDAHGPPSAPAGNGQSNRP